MFLFFGELEKGTWRWLVRHFDRFGLVFGYVFFSNQQLTVTADQSVGWDVWVFFPGRAGALGRRVFFPSRLSRKLSGHPTNSRSNSTSLWAPCPELFLRGGSLVGALYKGIGTPINTQCDKYKVYMGVDYWGYHPKDTTIFPNERLFFWRWEVGWSNDGVDQWIIGGDFFFECFSLP